MKILFCTNKFANVTNGPAKFAHLLLDINRTYAGRHELRILTEDVAQESKYIYKLDLRYPSKLRLASQFFRMRAYHQAAQAIRAIYDFDVIVYNNALVGLLSARAFPYSVGMINDSENLQYGWRQLGLRYEVVKTLVFRQCESLSTRYFTKIITNSNALTEQIRAHYPACRDKVHRLYKSVEMPLRHRPIDAPLHEPPRILFVKTDALTGGLPDLVEALRLLDRPLELLVIGPPKELAQMLTAPLQQSPVRVELLGGQPQAEVFRYLTEWADVFCVPSRREALGVANLEAMIRAVPVVTTHVGGIPETMNNGRNGWMAPPNNPLALAEKLAACLDHAQLRAQKVEYGLAFVQRFSKEQMLANFLTILTGEDMPSPRQTQWNVPR